MHSPDQTADRVGDAMSEFGVKEDKFRVNVNTTDATNYGTVTARSEYTHLT